MQSLQGYLLVAVPHQLDPNFVQTVVLVVQHSDRGALGLIVNCPREQRDGVPAQETAGRRICKTPTLYFGGPVTGPLMAVHCDPALGEFEILPGLFFSGGEEKVLAVMQRKRQPSRIFAGYTGWGPKQLEYEIDQGVWRTVEATSERIFSLSEDLWYELHREAVEAIYRAILQLEHIPSDPMLN
jgi:putative transcriptional regulator